MISGNVGGIVMNSDSDDLVVGNYIGTDTTGTIARGNSGAGVLIENGSSSNTIGGATSAFANVISGNTGYGVQVDGATTIGNVVANNDVGTGALRRGVIPNAGGALEITNGAAVLAAGAFVGNVVNQGTLGFWNDAPGIITITGDYTQSPAATLDVDLGGTAYSEYNQLQVSGTATLAGTLEVALIDGFSISPLEVFQVLTYDTLVDTFATYEDPTGGTLYPSYGPSALSLFSSSIFQVVTTTADTGAGSLREAIAIADASGNSLTTIGFDIPDTDFGYSDGAWTISPASPLPEITAPVFLDGTTQPGFTNTPLIVLDGTNAGSTTSGLTIAAGAVGSTIRGLVIDDFGADGISVQGSDITVAGNYLGVDFTGTIAKGNGKGIVVSGANNTIGGTTAGAGNVISGNVGDGLDIDGLNATGNLVAGNWIGTNPTGTGVVANIGDGVFIDQSAGDTIGGTVPAAANLISGNTSGIEISDSSSNYIQGNMIGIDTTGTFALGNSGAGVLIDNGSSANTVGGAIGGVRNVISGNAEGVSITGSTATLVANNFIGTDNEGTSPVGNRGGGIVLASGSGTTIGGSTSLASNVISGNTGDGIDIGSGASSTLVQGNYVGTDQTGTKPVANTQSGLALAGASGVTLGGTVQGVGNVISGNDAAGVSISGNATAGVLILGNRIGTNYAGELPLGNATFGIITSGIAGGVTIGGTASGDGNIISANATAGIGLYADSTGALIERNLIGTDITASVSSRQWQWHPDRRRIFQ